MAQPQLWGWGTAPLSIAFWGWERSDGPAAERLERAPGLVHVRGLSWSCSQGRPVAGRTVACGNPPSVCLAPGAAIISASGAAHGAIGMCAASGAITVVRCDAAAGKAVDAGRPAPAHAQGRAACARLSDRPSVARVSK